MLFLDGVGIGKGDPSVNPFFAAKLPAIRSLFDGELPSLRKRTAKIGTNTVDINAHFAEADPMNRLSAAANSTMEMTSSQRGIFKDCSSSTPSSAISFPRFDSPNQLTN